MELASFLVQNYSKTLTQINIKAGNLLVQFIQETRYSPLDNSIILAYRTFIYFVQELRSLSFEIEAVFLTCCRFF